MHQKRSMSQGRKRRFNSSENHHNHYLQNSQMFHLFIEASPTLISIDKIKTITQKMEFDTMVKILRQFFKSKQQFCERAFNVAHVVIKIILQSQISHLLLEAYLYVLSYNKFKFKGSTNYHSLVKLLDYMPLTLIPYYIDTFQIQLAANQCKEIIEQLIQLRRYRVCCKMITISKMKEQYGNKLIQKAFKENDHKIDSYMVSLGYSQKDYPQIQEKLLLQSMFEFLHERGWHYCEEIFALYPKVLAILIHEMMSRHKLKMEAISICFRKPQILLFLKESQIMKKHLQELKNPFPNPLHTDLFAPSDSRKYFKFSDFGIHEKDIIFIDKNFVNIEPILKEIVNADEIGVDTQSIVARTKLNKPLQLLALIQIATQHKVYVFDPRNLQTELTTYYFSLFFSDPLKRIVGHTIRGDYSSTAKAFGYFKEVKCQVIEVKQAYKRLFPGQRAGLQKMSENVLGKPICKEYTLTDWSRRPLLKNQIHYAALDAYIVLKINEKQKEMMRRHG